MGITGLCVDREEKLRDGDTGLCAEKREYISGG